MEDNLGDLSGLYASCDLNGDESLSICEYHVCVINYENEWRLSACPEGYPSIYCDCPFSDGWDTVPNTCPGEWTCDDIEWITASDFEYLDANYDGLLDINDNLELTDLGNACDINGDNALTVCEYHLCVIMYENSWRADNCPEGYPEIWCDCPFETYEVPDSCPGEWTCDDIAWIAAADMDWYD
jgi:hypothetical protein